MYLHSPLDKCREPLEALPLGALQMRAPSLARFGRLGLKTVAVPDLPFTASGIEAAFRVLERFEAAGALIDGVMALEPETGEQHAMAAAAFGRRDRERTGGQPTAPVTAEQLIEARRPAALARSLWAAFQRAQQNGLGAGQPGRTVPGGAPISEPSEASTAVSA